MTCTCGHPRAGHVAGLNGCRFSACRCEQFVDGAQPQADETEHPRRLVVDIPEGFFATVTIYPVDAAESEEDVPDVA